MKTLQTDKPTAYFLQGERLERGELDAFFPFFASGKHVISLVGGGGKTTLLYFLAGRFLARGRKTVVMTTTKIGAPGRWCETMEQCRARWAAGEIAFCGRLEDGKFRAPALEFLAQLLDAADAVIVEADGARRLPCKAPAAHEPVILPQTDVVIGVMGLDALGEPVEKVCLRHEAAMRLLGCGAQHLLAPADLATLLLSPQGTRKGVGERDFYIVLNKCDDERRLALGAQALQILREMGHERAALAAGMRRSETFEGLGI